MVFQILNFSQWDAFPILEMVNIDIFITTYLGILYAKGGNLWKGKKCDAL